MNNSTIPENLAHVIHALKNIHKKLEGETQEDTLKLPMNRCLSLVATVERILQKLGIPNDDEEDIDAQLLRIEKVVENSVKQLQEQRNEINTLKNRLLGATCIGPAVDRIAESLGCRGEPSDVYPEDKLRRIETAITKKRVEYRIMEEKATQYNTDLVTLQKQYSELRKKCAAEKVALLKRVCEAMNLPHGSGYDEVTATDLIEHLERVIKRQHTDAVQVLKMIKTGEPATEEEIGRAHV